MNVSRRETLMLGAFGALGAAGLALPLGGVLQAKGVSQLAPANMPVPFRTAFAKPPVLTGRLRADDAGPFMLYEVVEKLGSAKIVPGLSTPVFGYNGTAPGPTIKVQQGMRVKLRVRNQLPALHPKFGHPFNTSTHLHGSASKPQFDGFADDIAHPGDYKDYEYPNWQPARTLWYHDHNVHTTAENAYSGLAAQYHMTDSADQALLPQGDYDIPMTITDAMFAADGSLAYDDRSHSGLMGDVILVNGKAWPILKVKPKIYRFRVLNASISRSLRLRLSNRAPMFMVATDGGMMPQSRPVVEYRHAGAERYEWLVDFSKFAPGTNITLENLSNKNNVDYDNTNKVMRFQVVADGDLPPDTAGSRTLTSMPGSLVSSEAMSLGPQEVSGRLSMRLERDDVTNLFQISGKTWHDVVDSGYTDTIAKVNVDEVQEWDIENRTGGGWFHPLHIHLVDFQIVSRNGQPAFDYEKGPKDVVYVGEDETVRVRMKFSLQKGGGNSENAGGRYMIHCHNLPHEDHDMMTQFAVGDPDVNDPITAAPCKPDTGAYDDGRPTVSATTPAKDAKNIAVGVNVTATFPEAVTGVNGTTMTLASATGPVAAVVTLNAAGKFATLNPTASLAQGTTYTVTLAGDSIRDAADIAMAPTSWSFTTTGVLPTPPAVTSLSPGADAAAVLPEVNVIATFSKAVTGVSGSTFVLRDPSGTQVPAAVTSTATRAVLNPAAALLRRTVYTAVLNEDGVASPISSGGLAVPTTTWTFTTTA